MTNQMTWALLAGLLIVPFSASAQEARVPGIVVPLDVSTPAFRQFQSRPQSELSKLLYLIDVLEKTKLEIVYDGRYYNSRMVSPLIRLYLSRNYKEETAENWITKWCHRSKKGTRVYVKLADGNMLAAKDILMGELERLASLCRTA